MNLPKGYRYAGIHAGLKPQRKDVALILSEVDAAVAACCTVNTAAAAPILDTRRRTPTGHGRAIIINSGNANALTGPKGIEHVERIHESLAAALGVSEESVFSASTGVIGIPLPAESIIHKIPELVSALNFDPEAAAVAMMTTDTKQKLFSRVVHIDDKEITLAALAKGSGMIAPALATMIVAITTDANIPPNVLHRALSDAMKTTFNALTVDGDMSTNDVVFVMANGLAQNRPIQENSVDYQTFFENLRTLCAEIARDIAADGEGATKLLDITVRNAPSEDIAIDLARSVAVSPLVKAAMFGADPNWGRVLATIGARTGSCNYPLDPYQAQVTIQNLVVYDRAPTAADLQKLRQGMRENEVFIDIDVRAGESTGRAYGCDLSYDYVKINGDYTSLVVSDENGTVKKDDRLTNYSPKFKVSLLVEALSYISKLEGRRIVIKYGGAAMVHETLKRSFCEDIGLLRSVGARPVIVHGGGPEISKMLEKLGNQSQFIGGQRVTSADDMRVVEMVLSGSVNADIVTLLNMHGTVAFGMSGKDGSLLRAKKLLMDDGQDLGLVGEVAEVNSSSVEMLLRQDYVPVISPVGMGPDGQSYNINADNAAAAIAAAISADKLIYVTDVAGLMRNQELISVATTEELKSWLASPEDTIRGGMRVKVQSILRAIEKGVKNVHIIDGRSPHSLIAELFTDQGIGTLVQN